MCRVTCDVHQGWDEAKRQSFERCEISKDWNAISVRNRTQHKYSFITIIALYSYITIIASLTEGNAISSREITVTRSSTNLRLKNTIVTEPLFSSFALVEAAGAIRHSKPCSGNCSVGRRRVAGENAGDRLQFMLGVKCIAEWYQRAGTSAIARTVWF